MSTETVKVVLLGEAGVGKTCIISQFISGVFDPDTISSLITQFITKTLDFKDLNKSIKFEIWDTAGQERFRSLGRRFYKDAFIVLLVYDITNAESFNNIKEVWYPELEKNGEKKPIIGIVGNKMKLYEEEKVSETDARKYSESINGIFHLVSAKTGEKIDILFKALIDEYYRQNYPERVNEIMKGRDAQKLQPEKNGGGGKTNKKKKCC